MMGIKLALMCAGAGLLAVSGCSSSAPTPAAGHPQTSEAVHSASTTAASATSTAAAAGSGMADWYRSAKVPLKLWIDDLNTVGSLVAIADRSTLQGVCQATLRDANAFQAAATSAPDAAARALLGKAEAQSALATGACIDGDTGSVGAYVDAAVAAATAGQARAEKLS